MPPSVLYLYIPYTPLTLLLYSLMLVEMKSRTLLFAQKKKGRGWGVWLVVWLMCKAWFLDRYILPRSFRIQLVQQEGKAGNRRAGINFPPSPHCLLNRGSPLRCLWPLEERGRGFNRGFFVTLDSQRAQAQQGPIYWLQPLHARQRAVVPTLLVLWVVSCSTEVFILKQSLERYCVWQNVSNCSDIQDPE